MTAATVRSPVAVVTGASRGLGATLARFLALERYRVILTARGADPLEAEVVELQAGGLAVESSVGSVVDPAHREALARRVGELGGLDLLVNNASELGPSPLPRLAAADLVDLRTVLEVNLVAPLALVQGLIESLTRRRGMIVNISSDTAVGGYPGWGVYGASKAALDLGSKTLAEELRGRGVAVVSVDPGDMRTAMHQLAFPGADISDRPQPAVT
ncbi:MAG TPA: SDR family NAD(P)-dependent oxidoreductase, partial [Thermoplasmata archaeon]|nr:SDR family NAD(P)-dependent oxidoreductase [Thermoplasmata archaeon]